MAIMEPRKEWGEDLAHLQTLDADPRRIERIRARCLTALEAQGEREPWSLFAAWRRWLEPAAALGLGALYLAAAIGSSIALFH